MPDTRQPRVFIIAEAGVNHNGDPELARRLVDAAVRAGADAIKFQTFKAELLLSADAPKAAYQMKQTDASESQFDMLKRLELAPGLHFELAARARAGGLEFMSTPFDEQSATFLVREVDVERLKIPSGEITNGPLLLHAARLGQPIILSTGASTMDEIADALGVIAFGLSAGQTEIPDSSDLRLYGKQGADALSRRVTLLHCTTDYPAPAHDANLHAMAAMREAFSLPVGLSDHSLGTALPVAATALGAAVIEKHLTLDRNLPGPDHAASVEPVDFAVMVKAVREVESALGDGLKRPAPCELANRAIVRRSLVALTDIREGAPFTPANLGARRPGGGVSAMRYWQFIGRPAGRSYGAGELIEP